ncbi:MAG: TauD/TfdA family dioxygenase [Betaproteobacteria bacterium]|nr:TauD/TfdA family dioxygenase [Betaproteobacteria bacterium]
MQNAPRAARIGDLPIFDNEQSWYGPDMAARDDWIHEFTRAQVAEIDAAVKQAEAVPDIIDIGREHFAVPSLAPLLQRVHRETLHGRGFILLRGIPVERYTVRQAAIAYWGLGLYLGEAVSQNGKGHVLGHVTNLGLDYADPEVRGYQTSARLNYHADSSDLVALLCLRASKSGGLSSIASSTTLWNELVRTRPDHARTLMQPLYYTRWGEIPEGKQPWAEINVFTPCNGRMIASYVRSSINKSQTLPSVPRLTPAQVEAMDCLDALAADARIHLDMEFRPGDIQILCNHSILHSRTAYVDWPEVEKRRHLLRLWLACDDGPVLPQFMIDRFQGLTAGGRPDGIRVPGMCLVAPLDPV